MSTPEDKRPGRDADAGEERSMWSRPGTIAAIVLVVFAVVAGAFLALRPDPETTAPDTEATTEEPTVAAEPLPLPEAGPADTVWTVIDGGSIVPVSAEHGPANDDGTLATGYAPTPEGALIAAAQIAARSGSSMPDATWQAVIEQQMVPGADADSLAAANAAAPAADLEAEPAHIAGFVYESFTADEAVFDLYLVQGDATFALSMTMVWNGSDWLMTPPTNGDWATALSIEFTLEGVVLWGPDV